MITKRPDPEGRIGEVSASKRVCCGRGFMQLIGEELMAKEKMTTDSHGRGSGKSHGRGHKKEDAKVNGKKMSPEEVEMEEYICEPEQGEFLGDSEDEGLKIETSSKTKGSYGFKSKNLWMFAGERQLAHGMTTGIREREIAIMKVQLQVLEEWLQEQKNQNGKWIFPLKGKRVIWRQL